VLPAVHEALGHELRPSLGVIIWSGRCVGNPHLSQPSQVHWDISRSSPATLSLAHAGSDLRNARGRFSTQSALVAVWGNLELAFVEAAHLSGFIGALKVRLRVPPG
jgi:hypothetical protein